MRWRSGLVGAGPARSPLTALRDVQNRRSRLCSPAVAPSEGPRGLKPAAPWLPAAPWATAASWPAGPIWSRPQEQEYCQCKGTAGSVQEAEVFRLSRVAAMLCVTSTASAGMMPSLGRDDALRPMPSLGRDDALRLSEPRMGNALPAAQASLGRSPPHWRGQEPCLRIAEPTFAIGHSLKVAWPGRRVNSENRQFLYVFALAWQRCGVAAGARGIVAAAAAARTRVALLCEQCFAW